MEFVCRRCQHITKRTPYRVTSKEGDVVLINMVVCASCARLAKRLGLPVVKMNERKEPPSENTIRRHTTSHNMFRVVRTK